MPSLRIGDLARLGGVSVRMLRHYHQVGLLVPDHIDPHTGYRSYDMTQVEQLAAIVGLRATGLNLSKIGEMLANDDPSQSTEILQQRRATINQDIEMAHQAINRIDHLLDQLAESTTTAIPKEERPMTTTKPIAVELKSVPARLVAQLTAVSDSWEPQDIGPTIQPLYPELIARMEKAGVAIAGPSTAWYEDTADGKILVHATLTIAERPAARPDSLGFEIVELPAVGRVASTIHTGTMDNCDVTYDALSEWIESNGHTAVGYSREIDIECEPDKSWIVELQQPLAD